jgi:diadenosine tetraphosphate (Ap4A) HIT family hydrolase
VSTAIHRLVEACRSGNHAPLVARMASGWAIMGERQVLPGYCLLLPDPVVPHLNVLATAERDRFLADLGRLGDAVLAATGAVRINYAIFGNLEPALHAHVHPRYANEPAAMRSNNPWAYDWSQGPAFSVAEHGALLAAIRGTLEASGQHADTSRA